MISSQLQAQLFSKMATWEILCARGKVWGGASKRIQQLRVEVWAWSVHVYLPPAPEDADTPQGLSIILSYWDYLDWFMQRSQIKSQKLTCFEVRKNIFTVSSFQGQTAEPHTVVLRMWDVKCDCMLFRCLTNRIAKECPYFYSLMKKSRYFAGQPVCHHIEAALNKSGHYTLESYLESRRTRAA